MVANSFYEKVITLSLLGLAFTPIVVTSNTLVSLIIAKVTFIRLMIAIAWFALAIYLLTRERNTENTLDWRFFKNPLFMSVFTFTILAGISTALAVNPYRSFFGTITRGGGYIHLLYMFAFLVVALLIFKRQQWLQFFKMSLIAGAMVSTDAILSYIQTGERAEGIFFSNPTFISAYLLFVILSALVVLVYENRRSWRRFSYVVLSSSLIGLVVSNTRSVVLGLVVALLVVSFYLAVNASGVSVRLRGRHIGIRRLAIQLLIFMTIFGAVFVLTPDSYVWKKIPGLDRFAELSTQAQTVQSRIVAAKISLASVNPANVGFQKFLFGWGPDNYNLAFNKHFDPSIQRYEMRLFDRAHNEVLDVLVMNGLMGLAAYLFIWFFVFKAALTASLGGGDENKELLLRSSMMFFGIAYFVHNLAFFDQISTYVPIFVFWGFSSHLLQKERPEFDPRPINKLFVWIAPTLGLFLLVFFYTTAFVPYMQMSKLTEGLRRQNPTFIVEHLNKIASPFNYAQAEIRKKLVLVIADIINNPEVKPLVDRAWALMEEIVSIEPLEPRNMEALALSYQTYGENSGSQELIKRAEGLLRRELELIPGRQETLFLLAKNLIAQGRLEEGQGVAEDLLATDPASANANLYYSMIMFPLDWSGARQIDELITDLFYKDNRAFNVYIEIDAQQISYYRNIHRLYLAYYYNKRDTVAFRSVLLRAIKMEDTLQLIQEEQIPNGFLSEPVGSTKEVLEQALNSFDRYGWGTASP